VKKTLSVSAFLALTACSYDFPDDNAALAIAEKTVIDTARRYCSGEVLDVRSEIEWRDEHRISIDVWISFSAEHYFEATVWVAPTVKLGWFEIENPDLIGFSKNCA